MKTPTLISLVAGVVAAGIAMSAWVKTTRQNEDGGPGPTTTVLLAKSEIPYAAEITAEMLSAVSFKGAQSPIAQTFAKTEDLVGRVTSARIVAGAPITGPMLAPVDTPPGPRNQIPNDYRWVTVKVERNAARHLDPGNHVDVYGAADRGLILQNVEVLAVGDRREGMKPTEDAKAAQSVALLVPVEEAPKLFTSYGAVHLMLRGATDTRIIMQAEPTPEPQIATPVKQPVATPVKPAARQPVAQVERPPPGKMKVKVYNGPKGEDAEYDLPVVDDPEEEDPE